MPGFEGLSGQITGNEQSGQFAFDVHQGLLDAPALMHEPLIKLDNADITGRLVARA